MTFTLDATYLGDGTLRTANFPFREGYDLHAFYSPADNKSFLVIYVSNSGKNHRAYVGKANDGPLQKFKVRHLAVRGSSLWDDREFKLDAIVSGPDGRTGHLVYDERYSEAAFVKGIAELSKIKHY